MNLHIDLQIASKAPGLPSRQELEGWVAAALAGRREQAELTVRLVDEPEGRDLNRDYRGKDYATNVLSFPFEAPPGVEDEALLGDLIICAPVVAREAAEQGKSERAHWAHMVIHGTLHLLGHDHQEDEEAAEMESAEIGILERLGFPDPYDYD